MMKKDNILVVIAARGGSKGLKNKNIRALVGMPLIAYTIQQAKKWGMAQDIVCSTDSKKIAAIAKKYGAQVPFMRPSRLAGDRVGKMRVLRHALIRSERMYHKTYDIIIDLDVTAPMRKIDDLSKCLKIFKKEKPDVLFSAVKSHKNPYFNMIEKMPGGNVRLCKEPIKPIFSRQQAPIVYAMNASIYFFSRKYLLDKQNLTQIARKSSIYAMDDISRFDIDSEIDFKFIEFLAKKGIWRNEIR